MFVLEPVYIEPYKGVWPTIGSKYSVCVAVGPISPPQPPSVSAWNKPLTSFPATVSSEVWVTFLLMFSHELPLRHQ